MKSLFPVEETLGQGSGGGGNTQADLSMAAGHLLESSTLSRNWAVEGLNCGGIEENRLFHVKLGLNAL